MQFIKQYRKQLLLVLFLLTVALIGWQIYLASTFRLVSVSPNSNKPVASSTEEFRLVFSKELDSSKNYSLQFAESKVVESVKVEKSTLIINIKTLDSDTSYGFSIKNVVAKNSKTIAEVRIKFSTKYIPYNELTDEQKDTQLKHTDAGNAEDPLDKFLPHGDLGYYLTGQFTSDLTKNQYSLTARISLSSADVKSGREAAIEYQKQLIRDFILSKALDPSKYPITYEIVDPPF